MVSKNLEYYWKVMRTHGGLNYFYSKHEQLLYQLNPIPESLLQP